MMINVSLNSLYTYVLRLAGHPRSRAGNDVATARSHIARVKHNILEF